MFLTIGVSIPITIDVAIDPVRVAIVLVCVAIVPVRVAIALDI